VTRSRRNLAASVCFAVAVGSAGVVVWREAGAHPSGQRAGPAAAPVLSMRRIPEYLARLGAARRLTRDLDVAFAGAGFDGATGRACLVVHDARGRALYSRQPDLSLLPASTVKLLTAATVFERLGADARLTTEVRASQPPVDGIVDGDLWLVGGGDPLLATATFAVEAGGDGPPRPGSRIEDLADRVVASGVREVRGRLLGDESRYDTLRYVPTWRRVYVADGESGPLSALTVNDGFIRLRPAPPLPAAAPATAAARVLSTLLEQRGVQVGGTGEGVAPPGAVPLATLESLSMRDVVAEMLQLSDNTTAELLTKELGFRFGGAGTTAAGLDVIRASAVETLGALAGEFMLADGSGLDRANRATCDGVVALLDGDAAAQTLRPVLPIAAQSGTLRGRFVGTPVAGRLAAKTGSLEGVVALSGYARDERDEVLVFSTLVSDPDENVARLLVDRVARILVEHPDGPSADELAP
jgi:D-alanyl-D-alanine carboxypeptidase/D-alanyl-D-alanine-endopeptidase (penicillin-binding protein 4)